MEKSINCYTNETTNAFNKINRQIIFCEGIFGLTFFPSYCIIYFIEEMGFLSGKRSFAERVARFFFYVYNII